MLLRLGLFPLRLRVGLCAVPLLALASGACDDPQEPKSSGATNWLRCAEDSDCAAYPGALCAADGFCVDERGQRLTPPTGEAGAGPVSPAASGEAGADGGGPASGGTGGSDAPATGGSPTGGAQPTGGRAAGGAGPGLVGCRDSSDCDADERCAAPTDPSCGGEACARCAIPLSEFEECEADADCAGAGERSLCDATCRACVEPCRSDSECLSLNGSDQACGADGRCRAKSCDTTACTPGFDCVPATTTNTEPMTFYYCMQRRCSTDDDCADGAVCVLGASGRASCAPSAGACEAAPPFACGDLTCNSLKTHYCETFLAGPAPLASYNCRELPAACAGTPSCDCMDALVVEGAACSITIHGNVELTLPPAP